MNFSQSLYVIADQAMELLYPTCCLGCDKRGAWFCFNCAEQSILERDLDHCQLCNRIVKTPGALCLRDRSALGLTGLVSFGDYRAAPLRRAVRLVKFEGIYAGIPGLIEIARTRYQSVLHRRNWSAIVPIPLSRQRLRERGFNQAGLISRAIARLIQGNTSTESFTEHHGINPPRSPFAKGEGLPPFAKEGWGGFKTLGTSNVKVIRQLAESIVSTNLIRMRDTQHQTKLGRREREENMKDVFAWQGDRLDGPILLVDDVVTTGATLASAARVLRAHGAREVWGLTLAYESAQSTSIFDRSCWHPIVDR